MKNYIIQPISHSLADAFLIRHHYLAQQGNGFLAKEAYGLFDVLEDTLLGVITFSGISVVETLIGAFEGFDRTSSQYGFWELSRLAMIDDERKEKNLTSWFVGRALKQLRKDRYVRAVISYADSKYHNGYIYQATNFKYYGLAPQKNDFFYIDESGNERQLWRGTSSDKNGEWRPRSRKHRYMQVYDKSLKIKWVEQPYPKGDNHEYRIVEPNEYQLTIFG